MNSIAGGSDAGGLNEDVEADEAARDSEERSTMMDRGANEMAEDAMSDLGHNIDGPTGVHETAGEEEDLPDRVLDTLPLASPAASSSIPDDSPSAPESLVSLDLRGQSSPRGSLSRAPSGALQPFERRFQSRFSLSPSPSPRAGSPAFLNVHSRQSSMSTQLLSQTSQDGGFGEEQQAPWEVIRWTRLKRITGQAFSEIGKRSFGSPTCLAVSASIVIGTSKGLILVFDYRQTLKSVIGQGTKAIESGAISSLAIAADYSTVAGGHATGHLFTWEIAHPAKPFLHIPPAQRSSQQTQQPDGHLPGRAILHIGFLGTRHTALVSADDGGMAFSHLATRGLGAIARSVRTTRLLGRYPSSTPQVEVNRKPSSVLAFSPLPLGNVEQSTDTMGITALLTPYLLVIVSTTPIAQTQHKEPRPKDIAEHGALSGCLAWFPAVKLKVASSGNNISQTKLVYCWSNVLSILDVEVIAQRSETDKDKPPSLAFHTRDRWKCEEAIVAVQWLSRSVVGALTISQRLVILEDSGLHVMDSVDLLHRHIYRLDAFSRQLHPVVEQSENESSIHGVVADAFFMSFRVYKGRLFLLGNADVSVGTLSNWADRLSALVEQGDDIAAIRLAVSYYTGDVGKVSVGLPEDQESRHRIVRERILELLSASLQYTFSGNPPTTERLRELAAECFDACLTVEDLGFLFDDAYEYFHEGGHESVYLERLESYILEEEISFLPPPLVKDLVSRYITSNQGARLEELLCRLDPHTFDIDQITTLCKRHHLYDALIYVWNQALLDYITPLVDLLTLVKNVDAPSEELGVSHDVALESAKKVFPYLAYSLTGRLYPKGESIDDVQAEDIKAALYRYLFSDQVTAWPPDSSRILQTLPDNLEEPSFPYLRLLLNFDTASFMSMLNEAFEDPFLNTVQEQGSENVQKSGTARFESAKITRQQIISVLLEIMSGPDFEAEQTIYLDMFIARSLPKYSQFMILSGSSLQQILHRLCTFDPEGAADMVDDCQLSVEYLLSVYHPAVTPALIELIRNARFYRVLKSLYRSDHQCTNLIRTYFEDPVDKAGIFVDLGHCLRLDAPSKQVTEIKALLCSHADALAAIDLPETARVLLRYLPDVLDTFLAALDESRSRFVFLRTLLEPLIADTSAKHQLRATPSENVVSRFCEQYVQLMCVHDPRHVADYIGLLKSGDLRIDQVLPAMEENGAIDAAVLLLAQDGLARDAMERLVKHMRALQNALCSLIHASTDSPDVTSAEEAATDLVEAIDKYSKLGIWLCQGQSAATRSERRPQHRTNIAWDVKEEDLDLDEWLWLTLVDVVVSVAKEVAAETARLPDSTDAFDGERTTNALRTTVQQVFTALLGTTASPSANAPDTNLPPTTSDPSQARAQPQAQPRARQPRPHNQQTFLRIFRAFLTRATLSAPSLSDLRAVLLDIFSAYAYESDVLSLATQLLGRDVFADVAAVHRARQRGWRPRAQACEHCKRRAWGPRTGEGVWDAWVRSEEDKARVREAKMARGGDEDGAVGRAKGKASVQESVGQRTEDVVVEEEKLALVVFACRHVFHRACLDQMRSRDGENNGFGEGVEVAASGRYSCPVCRVRE